MRNLKTIIFGVALLFANPMWAQDVTEQYNAYTSFISFFNSMRADTPNGLEKLEAEYKKTKNALSDKQRYPKFTNFVAVKSDYMYASLLNLLGKYDQSLKQLENIRSSVNGLSETDYPIDFSSGGQTYTMDAASIRELKQKHSKLLTEVKENRQNTGGGDFRLKITSTKALTLKEALRNFINSWRENTMPKPSRICSPASKPPKKTLTKPPKKAAHNSSKQRVITKCLQKITTQKCKFWQETNIFRQNRSIII